MKKHKNEELEEFKKYNKFLAQDYLDSEILRLPHKLREIEQAKELERKADLAYLLRKTVSLILDIINQWKVEPKRLYTRDELRELYKDLQEASEVSK